MNPVKSLLRKFCPQKHKAKALELIYSMQGMKKCTHFFFFPYNHVGGAERVHIDILNTIPEKNLAVIFSERSENNAFLSEFEQASATCISVHEYIKEDYTKEWFLKYCAHIINLTSDAMVFGCNSTIYYDLLPLLNTSISKLDLLHAFSDPQPGLEVYSLPFVHLLDHRVVINGKTAHDYGNLYRTNGLERYLDRVELIYNYGPIADSLPIKEKESLNIIYIGRRSEEKRVHLLGKVATKLAERGIQSPTIKFIGNMERAISEHDLPNCLIIGEVSDKEEVQRILAATDMLLLSSRREGFPMVIMEAMGQGCIPIATDVGGISEHLHHRENGMLISSESEEDIVDDMVNIILELRGNDELRSILSNNAYEYAKEHFEKKRFESSYRLLILNES